MYVCMSLTNFYSQIRRLLSKRVALPAYLTFTPQLIQIWPAHCLIITYTLIKYARGFHPHHQSLFETVIRQDFLTAQYIHTLCDSNSIRFWNTVSMTEMRVQLTIHASLICHTFHHVSYL